MKSLLRGRVLQINSKVLLLRNENQTIQAKVTSTESINLGDLIEIEENVPRVLTPNRTPNKTMKWMNRTLDPRRIQATHTRFLVESGIREFFLGQRFYETRTPLIVPCPGMEPHIRPFQVRSTEHPELTHYLPTSPEFAMKRLLVGGLERIFQLSSAFRDEPVSSTHNPEFTMLEWYRAYADYEDIMRDTENLFEFLAMKLFGKPSFTFQSQEIQVKTPWPRLRVRDLFQNHVGIDLVRNSTAPQLAGECQKLGLTVSPLDTRDDLYFRIWLNCIEPKLPADQAVFVTRYPASQAALARLDTDPDGSWWARRFELYAGGIELGNAFDELTDPVEQRKRFIKDMELREETYGPSFPKNPLDEEFLEALEEGMPPSGGIAVGVDRIVMLFADETDISYTRWI